MDGVKRIRIIVDNQKLCTQRAPTDFKNLLSLLKNLSFSEIKVQVQFGSKKGIIFDQKSYQKWIENSGFKGINLILNKKVKKNQIVSSKDNSSEAKIEELPKKRPREKNKKDNQKKKSKNQEKKLPQMKKKSSGLTNQLNLVSKPTKSPDLLFSSTAHLSQTCSELYNPEKVFISLWNADKIRFVDILTNARKEINNRDIEPSSRALMTENGIMITGGAAARYQAILIDKHYKITTLTSMWQPRFWHSMGSIDGYPAVFAGAENDLPVMMPLNSVEVFKDNFWIKYPDLRVKRASCAASWHGKYTYVIGGLVTNGGVSTRTDTLEKYDGYSWVILDIKLPKLLISPGCICINDHSIFVFGGEERDKGYSDNIFRIELETSKCHKYDKKLPKPTKFTYGQLKYSENEIIACDINLDIIRFDCNQETNILL